MSQGDIAERLNAQGVLCPMEYKLFPWDEGADQFPDEPESCMVVVKREQDPD